MNRINFIMSLPAAGLAIDGTVPAKGDGFTHTFNDSTLRDASTIEKVKLAMLGEEFALSDAASPGEAVLWAAKRTGDPIFMRGFDALSHIPSTGEYAVAGAGSVWISGIQPPGNSDRRTGLLSLDGGST